MSEPSPSPTNAPSKQRTAWVPVAYLLLALTLTWPLVSQMGSHVPRGDHDIWQNYWNLYWWKVALCERKSSPYRNDLIYRPLKEVHLGNHTHSPGNMIWTLPMNLLLGVPVALNLAVFVGFFFSALGAFLLAREYGARRRAAFLAGIVFAYFPQHVEQSLEHLNLASYYAMPFFLWALARMVREGGWWWLACGAFFAMNALFSWHNALMIISAGCVILVYEWCRSSRGSGRIALELTLSAILALILVSPGLMPLVADSLAGVAVLQKQSVNKPIDPLFLLIPHTGHPLWGESLNSLYSHFQTYLSVGFTAYIGVVALALSLSGFFPRRVLRGKSELTKSAAAYLSPIRGKNVWLGLLAFYLLLSFGETLTVAKQEICPMPFRWLKEIPLFGLVRVPNRFLVPAMLALAVLAAQGASRLAAPLAPKTQRYFLLALALLMVADYAWVPYPMRKIPDLDWTSALDAYPRDTVILNVPSGHRARAADDLLLQTAHGLPMVSGYSSTPIKSVDELMKRHPVLLRVFTRYQGVQTPEDPESADLPTTARELGVNLVLIHLDRTVEARLARREEVREESHGDPYLMRLHNPEKGIPHATLDRFRKQLRDAFGEPAVVDEGRVEIYEVR